MIMLNETKNKFKRLKEHILILAPVILSLAILLGYSYAIKPIYQERYFITFFPLACFFFLLINKNYFNRNKHLLLSICLISVIFLYGPRSLVPYTNYEDLVNKPDAQINLLIKFCDLDWDPNCLEFHKNTKTIKTVSYAQAREPIYKSSINSSSKYLKYLNKLKSVLKS